MGNYEGGEPAGSIIEGLWGNAMQHYLAPLIIGNLALKIVLKFLDKNPRQYYKHQCVHL